MAGHSSKLVKLNSFVVLALLRGTTPLMAYFAVSNLDSPGLVVAWKSAISLVFFSIMFLTLYVTDDAVKLQLSSNVRSRSTYWKLPLIGLIQAAAPYLLAVYSLKYLPPTLLSVFMAATPWFTILLERLPFVKIKSTINSYVKIGICIGLLAVLLVMSPILHESLVNCSTAQHPSAQNRTNQTVSPPKKYPIVYDICLDPVDLLQATVALVCGSLLWAISSVFWRSQRGDIHYTVSSIGQNLTATIIAVIFWAIFEADYPSTPTVWFKWRTVFGLAFLGLGTGWFATILVNYLSKEIGPKPTNQVLALVPVITFIEDCVIVKSVVTLHPWLIAMEILGILMLSTAVFLTNLPAGRKSYNHSLLTEQLIDSSHHSQHEGSFRDIQDEIEKYRRLPSVSEDDSSAREEEVSMPAEASSYPPLREIVGDNLNKTLTFGRS